MNVIYLEFLFLNILKFFRYLKSRTIIILLKDEFYSGKKFGT